MNAKELRIGNKVLKEYYEQGQKTSEQIHEVTSSDINHLDVDGYIEHGDEVLKPIELTDEILLKAGFELKSCFRKTVNNIEFILLVDIVLPYPRGYSMRLFVNGNYICNVEHFHHLQNIIFDLTGKELTL